MSPHPLTPFPQGSTYGSIPLHGCLNGFTDKEKLTGSEQAVSVLEGEGEGSGREGRWGGGGGEGEGEREGGGGVVQ